MKTYKIVLKGQIIKITQNDKGEFLIPKKFNVGTGLKPSIEEWILCRKPLSEKTVAMNVLKWGTGGINIDGCRIGHNEPEKTTNRKQRSASWNPDTCGFDSTKNTTASANVSGRFPSHLVHNGSSEVLDMFPYSKSGTMKKPYIYTNTEFSLGKPTGKTKQMHDASEGSTARFFYCAKPSRRERDAGLDGMDETIQKYVNNRRCKKCGHQQVSGNSCKCENPEWEIISTPRIGKNTHPTVKSLSLMKYLIKLITPPKGIVLDMFAGSGSTLLAAKSLGYRFIGIEREKDYCKIARKRIASIPKDLF